MNSRSIISTLAGIIAVAIFIALTPHMTFSPEGILLPAEKVRTPITDSAVQIYNETPANFERLGLIRIEQKFSTLDDATKNQLLQKVKTLAANVGANGVVINVFEPNNTEVGSILSFYGTAIYVNK